MREYMDGLDIVPDLLWAVRVRVHARKRGTVHVVRKAIERGADRSLEIGRVRRDSRLVEPNGAGFRANVDEVPREALAVDVHVPAAELRGDLAQVPLESRFALVQDESDAADDENEDGQLEPHATRDR